MAEIMLPIHPNNLIANLIYSKRALGNIETRVLNQVITVPGSGSNQYRINVPPDRVILLYNRHQISSSKYDKNTRFNFIIDRDDSTSNIDLIVNNIILDREKELKITYYRPARIDLNWTFINNTIKDIDVSINIEFVQLQVGFFERVYLPLLNESFDILESGIN
jgi:hypothetical protein